MKRVLLTIMFLLAAVPLLAQEQVEIKDGTPFWYVCMEFQGPHCVDPPQQIGIFIQELRKQELQSKISGDLFCIFFDSPELLGM